MRRCLSLLILSFAVIFAGCMPAFGPQSAQEREDTVSESLVLSETEDTVTFRDAQGEKTLKKHPQRVVCLYNSLLDLWYLSGGTAVARVDGDAGLDEHLLSLPLAGSMSAPSLEAVVAFEPDLVLLTVTLDAQLSLAESLEQNGIPYLMCDLRSDSFGGFVRYGELFAHLNGDGTAFEEAIQPVAERCREICRQTQEVSEQPTVAILYSAPKYVKLETSLSQTGQMTQMLGAQNIVSQQEAPSDGSVRIDLSFETLLVRDPDYILVVIMGDEEKCQDTFRQTLLDNPAWAELSAVKNGNFLYLPKEYSIYKPNGHYAEAFSYLAGVLYPELELR